ncbi:MAG: hypothetical protein D6730_24340 [Bacteroidetes bacterium]|nr:MAG: hypothetical protein D6730_24340 [Bacteroidota bacterium]
MRKFDIFLIICLLRIGMLLAETLETRKDSEEFTAPSPANSMARSALPAWIKVKRCGKKMWRWVFPFSENGSI